MLSSDALIHIAALCLALASAETLHGIARTVLLVPRLGKALALKLSIVSGSLLAFGVCWWFVPGIGLKGVAGHLALGLGLALFMAAFDLAMGRWLLRRPWRKLAEDFNPATGNLLVLGLGLLVVMPPAVAWLHGSPAR